MDRYQRVEKPREESPINENEIRITALGRMRNYISYATSLLQEKGSNEIVFKAMGRAINKTVMIVELIKRRIPGLHQITSIGSIDITDTWEPLEEGLLPLETTRHVSVVTITLSKTELDSSSVGYQHPLPSDQVKPFTELDYEGDMGAPAERGRGRGGRGRGRSRGSGNGNMVGDYGDEGWDNTGRGFSRGGWNRGRGRGFRGRGMGGGYGGRGDYQYEASGGYGMRGGYGGRGDYQYEASGVYGMRGGYGGRGDYPRGGRGRGDVGGYGGRPDYQNEMGGYDDGSFAPPRGRGRGRSRGQGRGRGRNFRANGGPV